MSEIPFIFTPFPKYFYDIGWLTPTKNGSHLKTAVFLLWCFSRCRNYDQLVFHDHTQVKLPAFSFIFGIGQAAKETGLTEKEVRGRLKMLLKPKLVKKGADSRAHRFTIYTWSTELFSENEGTPKGQLRADRGQTEGLQTRTIEHKNIRTTATEDHYENAAAVFLKTQNFSSEEINSLLSLPGITEARIKQAFEFVNHPKTTVKKTRIATMIWHCKSKTPPAPPEENLTEQQRAALDFNKQLADLGHPEWQEQNRTLIPENRMMIWLGGITSISLLNPTEELKKDFAQSKKELTNKKLNTA